MTEYFIYSFIYLAAAVIAVPIAKRLGLGSVLGYLIAGVIIGPIIGLVGDETTSIQHYAEFGVVMMLFLVGLELEPKMLWKMRHRLMGLGGLQIVLTTVSVAFIATLFVEEWSVALAIGLIFSLSSTAIVLQTFNEKSLTKTDGGQNAFSVLLFQDIAVIPMLALIPLLALPELIELSQATFTDTAEKHAELSLVAGIPGWAYTLVVIASIAIVVIGGHYLSRPLFKFVADSGLREIFTATALMLVIGVAALMSLVGLSPALGTFLAGVVLANSEFRHELESNIEPFKGLLLGVFFITVGAGINFTLLSEEFALIIGLTLAVMLLKMVVLLLLSFLFNVRGSDRWLFSLSLAQAGEFGFVLLSFSGQQNVLPEPIIQPLSLVVALSMFFTPALFILFDKVILPHYQKNSNQREEDNIDQLGSVIIAGAGRFGQITNRLLVSNKIPTVVLDHESSMIDILRSINIKSYYGDATRPDLLHTAGIEQASLLIIAIDDKIRSVELIKYVKHAYPQIKILARAYDRGHYYASKYAGADYVVIETYYSAVELGAQALIDLGFSLKKANQVRQTFQQSEAKSGEALYEVWRQKGDFDQNYRALFIQLEEELNHAMEASQTEESPDSHTSDHSKREGN
ncbi:monovalent cation:proton antiporter-2 (CPA2) family protein [Marinomonas sp. 15G1-11]|uniref:Monovalent cation:proton antiporter-2 (CPA2) family protein n=1 Tax=Marinomonas phaeophyticola TaxID=3004091 RepID=A0ABT4JRC0_9GAMM|nr:monovalent cation:proton antiporter-2 (CPA2) family protein [Marinomonas sp. 15G1-11]MCZ2720921.1 monovalent cation:proton antiporter-2 (CPA2) family protein [Marinomonas sp. 15G1-11]